MSCLSNSCGSSLLLSLPEDVVDMVSQFLLPRDVCSLSLCCKNLYAALSASEKVWLTQCDMVGMIPYKELVDWREGVSSYKTLCQFLLNVNPLLGTWDAGYFLKKMGLVIIRSSGILCLKSSAISTDHVLFSYMERQEGVDCVCRGLVKSIDKSCTVLNLEVEPGISRKTCVSNINEFSRPQGVVENDQGMQIPFSKLDYTNKNVLLRATSKLARQEVIKMATWPLFTRSRDDLVLLRERRQVLIQMHQEDIDEMQSELNRIREKFCDPLHKEDNTKGIKNRSMREYFLCKFKQFIGRSSSNGSPATTSKVKSKYEKLEDFLGSSDTLRLTLTASNVKLNSSFKAWPDMRHDSWYKLYKIPLRVPAADHVYAGLWGGTYGWPPGKPCEDKHGKGLIFVMLSYEYEEKPPGQQSLIATKVFEVSRHSSYPPGAPMFIVNVSEPSFEPFPLDRTDVNSSSSMNMDIQHAYTGEGITSGYTFDYPSSTPGSLFVLQNGVLAFVWKDSMTVFTLQRLDLQELLKKGERVPSLQPPTSNFAYW